MSEIVLSATVRFKNWCIASEKSFAKSFCVVNFDCFVMLKCLRSGDRIMKLINCHWITSFLLTIPPSVGYEQNPLSVYYCYDVEGETKTLTKCIAEVCMRCQILN